MFESDDWDLDQDFLNDVDEKATQFYSQTDDEESETKRRKINAPKDEIFSFSTDINCHEKNAKNKIVEEQNDNKVSRKNLILGMFNKNGLNENVSSCVQSDSKCDSEYDKLKSQLNNITSSQSSQLPRKNLVLDILKKKNVQDNVTQNNAKNFKSRIEDKDRITKQQDFTLLNKKTSEQNPTNNSLIQNNSNNNSNKKNTPGNLRKQLLCNILKQSSKDATEKINQIAKSNEPSIKALQAQPNQKVTLVRKFPGPAGLLPHDIDTTLPPVLYLNSLEENELAKDPNESDLPEYCSQNTKQMFTEGAWQLMLNELPNGFLKGHEIATIKHTAKVNDYSSTKAEYLAGIIEHIDHSHENPRVILKDFTDSIQGIIHKDIPLKYPGLLEQNVVLLLHDVGILRTSGTILSNKYQILISLSSLVAIYSSKGRIQHISYEKSHSEEETEEENHSIVNPTGNHSSKATCSKLKMEHSNNSKETINSKENSESLNISNFSFNTSSNEKVEKMNDSIDFDIADDFSFAISSDEIADSHVQKNFNTPLPKKAKHANKENKPQSPKKDLKKSKEEVSSSLLETLKKFRPNIGNEKKLPYKATVNDDHPVDLNNHLKEVDRKTGNTSAEEITNETDVNILQDKTQCVAEKMPTCLNNRTKDAHVNNATEKSRLSVRSKLLQFKSADVLTPPQNSKSAVSLDTEKTDEAHQDKSNENNFGSTLSTTKNDSDDEILSQMDMDTIFSNYNDES